MCLKGILLIVALTLGMPSVGQVNAKEIRLATQAPANALTKQGQPYIRCAMEKLNQPYTVKGIPWKRAQKATEQGHYDGFFMASKTQKRDKYATLSQPFIVIKWLYITKKEREISPLNPNFYSRIFIANLGSARHQWLEGLVKKGIIQSEIKTPPNELSSLKMLLLDRVDVALMSGISFNNMMTTLNIDKNKITIHTALEKPTGVYFSHKFIKENPGFMQEFNTAIAVCNIKP
ncbi:MAG: transporter substrate-binding domain-containing protein [Bermanella sp.]